DITTGDKFTCVWFSFPSGILFDGSNLWLSDAGENKLQRLHAASGAIIETIPLGDILPISKPVFDGSNIWVPVLDGVSVVSTSTPARIVATLTGNGLDGFNSNAAFDGERVMVITESFNTVSLWKAA